MAICHLFTHNKRIAVAQVILRYLKLGHTDGDSITLIKYRSLIYMLNWNVVVLNTYFSTDMLILTFM